MRLLGDGCRGTARRRRCRRSASLNIFAKVTLVRPRGRFRRGNKNGDAAEKSKSLNYFAATGLRCARMKNATGYITEAALPKRRLVGLFRACLSFSPRVVNSAEKITAPGRLTRPLVRFLRNPWCPLGAGGLLQRGGNQGDCAQMAWSPNHIATTDLRAARLKKYNRANIKGHGHETVLGSSVSSSWASFPAGRPSLPGS